jgi:predicted patatin/cPLA2 family phospholipase
VPNPNQNRILEPFDNIGLCFSGGGFRATFYALGVLSYLNRIEFRQKPLLESVTALSTVSGGTITGVGYALAHAKYMEIHEG